MAYYLVSYDQHRDRDYTPIWTALRGAGAVRVLESVWLLSTNNSAAQIREWLRSTTRNEDSLLVIQVQPGANWATYAVQTGATEWLQQKVAA